MAESWTCNECGAGFPSQAETFRHLLEEHKADSYTLALHDGRDAARRLLDLAAEAHLEGDRQKGRFYTRLAGRVSRIMDEAEAWGRENLR
jgi:hypothetical protein